MTKSEAQGNSRQNPRRPSFSFTGTLLNGPVLTGVDKSPGNIWNPTQIIHLHRLQRWLLRKSLAGQKIGRTFTSGETQTITSAIRRISQELGGRNRWKTEFARVISAWVEGTMDHKEATDLILGSVSDGPKLPEGSAIASQLSAAFGLFEASLGFEQRALSELAKRSLGGLAEQQRLEAIQYAVHTGQPDLAASLAEELLRQKKPLSLFPHSVQDLLHYVSVWNGNQPEGTILLEQDNLRWFDYIQSKKILVYGPGNTPHNTKPASERELVARIAGPGSHSWSQNQDLAQGRADIVYLIPDTLEAIGSTPEERFKKLGHFDFLCIKRGEAPYLPNSRNVGAASRMFLRGHPNMVPLAVIDLLRTPGTNVRVIGSDFFASGSSYRPDSIRTTPEGRPQTNQGSSGNRYDRSTLMASHNAFQNRRLIKNLLDSGRVTGDDAFLKACSLSDLDYARRLDLHYGQQRI